MTTLRLHREKGTPLILLIEDNEDDVFFFRRALSKLEYPCNVRVVGSVPDAKRYMLNEDPFDNATYFCRPDLIVSDFRLPGENGLAFIKWLREQPAHANVPVVMLSGATSSMNPNLFAGLAVSDFLRKTSDVGELGVRLQPVLPTASL